MILHPIYSIFLTIACFLGYTELQRKLARSRYKIIAPLFNPVLMSMGTLAFLLFITTTTYTTYQEGTSVLTLLLYPATVSLAIPLYRNLHLLKKHARAIVIGICAGVVTNACIVLILSKVFQLESILTLSLLPKSITTPIGLILSKQLGGIPELTVPVIVITGTVGILMGPMVLKLLGINHPVAKGIALGTASHALGTSKAIELGDTEGAMSGLAIGLTGVATAIILPWFVVLVHEIGLL